MTEARMRRRREAEEGRLGHAASSDENLRQAEEELRIAARLEAEEDEREAAQLARRTRSLSEVAFEAMHRGDRVAAGSGSRTFSGRVVYSAGDIMTLEADDWVVDFNLAGPITIRILEASRSGGIPRSEGPRSFRGRLLELEARPREVEIGSPLFPDGLRASIEVAAQDHLVARDAAGSEWFVPLGWIGYVARQAT